jgi:PAS domain S-box-containing protein
MLEQEPLFPHANSDQALHQIIDAIPALLWSSQPDGAIDFLNQGWLSFTGLSMEQALGDGWMQALHPDDAEETRHKWAQATRTRAYYEVEQRLRRYDGEYRWFLTRARPVLDAAGQVSHWYGVNVDITDRKQAEQEMLHASEDLVRFGSQIPGMIYQFMRRPDGSYCVPFTTEVIGEIFGCSPEDVREDFSPVARAIHPDDLGWIVGAVEESARTLQPFRAEYRVTLPGRPQHWIWAQSIPERLPDGSVVWSGFNADITERKLAEEKLVYQSFLLDNISEAIVASDDGYRLTAWNAAAEKMYGWTAGEVLGRIGLDIVQTQFREGDKESMLAQIVAQGYYKGEATQARRDGTRFPVEVSSYVLKDAAGQVSGYVSINRDVSELNLAKDELERFFNTVPDMVCIASTDGYFKQLNLEWERTLDYTREELMAVPLADFIHPDDREATFREIERQVGGQSILRFTNRYRARDGAYHWLEWNATPSPDGSTLYAAARDITQRRQAEQALRDSEAALNSFFNSTQAKVGIFHARWEAVDMEYLRLNQAAASSMGLGMEDLPGALASQGGSSERNRRLWLEECRLCQESGRPVQFEYLSDLLGGTWQLVTVSSLQPDVFSFVASDITELKRMQHDLQQFTGVLEARVALRTAELSQANRDLERAVRLRDEFLHNLSHELRTPLVSILGLSEALQAQIYGELGDRQRRAVDHIYASGRGMQALVDNLLMMAQLLAGKVTLQRSRVLVGRLLESCIKQVKPALQQKQVELSIQRDQRHEIILADEARLQEILVSLLDNAVKFTPPGGQVGLGMEVDEAAGQVCWVVWDTGIGIPVEEQGRLFELFAQLDGGLTRAYGGLGLGLAFVRQLVELHGGSIEVTSVPGEGSRFTVRLPLG